MAASERGIELSYAESARLSLPDGSLEQREIARQNAGAQVRQVQPPPRAAVAMCAAEALVVEREPQLEQPALEKVRHREVFNLWEDEHRERAGAALGGPRRQFPADDVRKLNHVEEFVSDRDRKTPQRLLPGIESGRNEDERSALGCLGERQSEDTGRQIVDVDVRLGVRSGGIREGQLESVALVVEESGVGGEADLLDVVGVAVAVVVVERRCVRTRGDVMDDGAGANVRRCLRRGVRVVPTGCRPRKLRRAGSRRGMCSQGEREPSGKCEGKKTDHHRHAFRDVGTPCCRGLPRRSDPGAAYAARSARSSAAAAARTSESCPGGAASWTEAGRPPLAGPQGSASAGQPVRLKSAVSFVRTVREPWPYGGATQGSVGVSSRSTPASASGTSSRKCARSRRAASTSESVSSAAASSERRTSSP